MEEITDLLRKEDTGLEESIKLYEEASELGRKLTKTLTEIQRKVEKVVSDNENELETEEWKGDGEDD